MTARIVVVEDDPSVAELVTLYLRNAEFIVAHARTAAEARVKFDEEKPALVILDLGLPDANGLDLLREIRKHADTPVLALTARAEDVQKIEALESGMDDYMTKPFNPKELVARVRAVLRRTAGMPGSGRTIVVGNVRIDPARHPVIEWRWRVLQTPADLDPRVHARDDSPARVIVAFHGDVKRLDIGERFALALYHALTGDKMPYAIIMYSWASDAPVGTITSNDQTGKIQTIVVGGGVGEWREFRRNVLEDYRRAFGEEPWDIVAVGVMTDASNTRGKARAQYGDISFRPEE